MFSLPQAVNQAQRRGEGVDTSKKCKNTTREYSSVPSLLYPQVQVYRLYMSSCCHSFICMQSLQQLTNRDQQLKTQRNSTERQRNFTVRPQSAIAMQLPVTIILFDILDERVTLDFGRTLQQARMAKSWTQKDLATVSQLGDLCVISSTLCCFSVSMRSPRSLTSMSLGEPYPTSR